MAADMKPEDVARLFHDTYERLAPEHGYQTRKESAVAWEQVPAPNKSLMTAVAGEVAAEVERMVREQVAKEIEANPERECSGAVAACARIARGGAR